MITSALVSPNLANEGFNIANLDIDSPRLEAGTLWLKVSHSSVLFREFQVFGDKSQVA
jgi:hypothetical protein